MRRTLGPLSYLPVLALASFTAAGCASMSAHAPRYAPSAAPVMVSAPSGEAEMAPSSPAPVAMAMAPHRGGDVAVANGLAHTPGATGPGAGAQGASGTTAATTPSADVATGAAPMLIYTGSVDVAVLRSEVTATLDRVVELAYQMGGWLVQRSDLEVQVRIPSGRFREGVRRLDELGEVLHRSIAAEDVSEEFNDLDVRLANLRAVRHRLEEFLARAANVHEALQVEQELERVTQSIDRIEGRMRFLRARASDSLLVVRVQPRAEPVAVPDATTPAGRRPLDLPVEWLDRLGLGRLLQIR